MDAMRRLLYLAIYLTFALTPHWWRVATDGLYVWGYGLVIPIGASLLLWLAVGPRPRRDGRLVWAGILLALAGWAWLSRDWAVMAAFPPGNARQTTEIATSFALQLMVAAGFALAVLWAQVPLDRIALVLAGVTILQALIVTAQVSQQGAIGLGWAGEFPVTPQKPGASVLMAGDIRWLRPYGLLPHPNNVGGWLAAGTLVSGGLLFHRLRWRRWLGGVAVTVGWWGLLLTFSRGAWVGFLVGGMVAVGLAWPVLRAVRPARRAVGVTLGGCVSVGLIFGMLYTPLITARVITPLQQTERTQAAVDSGAITTTEARSLVDRAVYQSLAWRSIRAHWLRGVGAGNLPWQISLYLTETDMDLQANYVHNVYLAAWGDLGAVGLGLYVGMLGGGVGLALRGPISGNRAAVLAAVIALGAANLFDYYGWALLPLQVLWWGLLAAALSDTYQKPDL